MTREAVKPVDENKIYFVDTKRIWELHSPTGIKVFGVSRFRAGDILWVRETWAKRKNGDYCYKANGEKQTDVDYWTYLKWKSPIFMPREASRITLEVKGVRIERVQDISEEDAQAEGAKQWFINWLDRSYSNPYWFYNDPSDRYWCEKHIEKALKQFKKDIISGKIETDFNPHDPDDREAIEDIGYMIGEPEKSSPIFCQTCGAPLMFSADLSIMDDDFEEDFEGGLIDASAPMFESLMCNYEEELFSRPNIYRGLFRSLWDRLNAKCGYSWESNPYVFVYEFMRV
jgi:hypothetical protein